MVQLCKNPVFFRTIYSIFVFTVCDNGTIPNMLHGLIRLNFSYTTLEFLLRGFSFGAPDCWGINMEVGQVGSLSMILQNPHLSTSSMNNSQSSWIISWSSSLLPRYNCCNKSTIFLSILLFIKILTLPMICLPAVLRKTSSPCRARRLNAKPTTRTWIFRDVRSSRLGSPWLRGRNVASLRRRGERR